MKSPLRFVMTTAFLAFASVAEAAMWSSVISNEKMRAEIDLASFMRQGNIVSAWDRDVYSVLEQARPGDFYFKSAKSLMRYNCSRRTADLLIKIYYAEDGSEITTVTATYYGKPNYVIPDTEGEQKFEYVCQYKTPEEKKLAAAAAAAAAAKKSEEAKKAKEGENAAGKLGQKAASGDKTKVVAQENPIKPPPISLPIRKPTGTSPKPLVDAAKGSAKK
jgi:hypothetical protein